MRDLTDRIWPLPRHEAAILGSMARKPPQTTVGQPTLSARQGYEKLGIQLERGESLQANDERGFGTWVTTTQHWVEQAFGERSARALEFFNAQGINVPVVVGSTDFGEIRRESLALRLNLLRSFTEVLKETAELQESQTDHAASPRREPTATNKVFLVHGRDDGVKQTVARFLEKLDLVPIILHEQPNSGRTTLDRRSSGAAWPKTLELRFTLHLHDRGKGVDDSKVLLALGFEGRGRGRSDDAPRG